MRVANPLACLLIIAICAYCFFTGYRSAFDTDQAGHTEKRNSSGDNPNFNCDHDLETDQWLLYELSQNHMPAKVIKRFRY